MIATALAPAYHLVMIHLLPLLLFLLPQDIPASEFQERRDRVAKKFSDGVVILQAQKLATGEPGIDENTARYDFSYLTGWYHAGSVLVLHQDLAILFTDDVEAAKRHSAVSEIRPLGQYEKFLKEVVGSEKKYEWRHPWQSSSGFVPVHDAITKLRLVKSKAEIACLKKAAAATDRAHVEAMKKCRPGMNEGELQKIIEDTFRAEGCPTNAFPSIVGSGKNGVILHYMENKDVMEKGTLVVMDIGAEYRGYAADITRTIPVDGKYGEEHAKAYQAVLDAQRAAEMKLKPGATWADLDRAAAAVLRERGYAKTGYMNFHGLGHYVGLSVHDSGAYREAFEPGMVITIEPGIYDRKAGYGIRIEDTYVVTEKGFERISAGSPREIEEIEKMMERK